MRAIQMTEFGGPEVLRLVELPVPEPGPGEALVRVTRVGMNYADTHVRQNTYVAKAKPELPLVPGTEVAGVREDTGERVIAMVPHGAYAEYAVAPLDRMWPVPDGVEDGDALALLVQGLTAWHLYRTSAQVRPGESVVIHGAAGGVGSLACQLGHPLGAGRVIAVASSDAKRTLALELGADAAIDSAPEGMKDRLLEANGGAPVDVVFEMSGGQAFDESLAALAPFGRCVAYGIATHKQNEVRTGHLMRHSKAVVGFWFMHLFARPQTVRDALDDLFARAARGELRAVVGATYPLADAAQAQIDMAARVTTGKTLLDPAA